MAKKKKTQLKLVARGFATTSVPKKADVAESAPSTSDCSQLSECPECPPSATEDTAQNEPDVRVDVQPQVQSLLDKYQDKVEKDISRTIKLIDGTREHSYLCRSIPHL
ncbi:hypothetical protein PISMIDRAFT_582012 [Pisolithus microcarpus 441]|uniref:Uncharacterized protein n=1 Tax=Pisolithus microcarpus 441 TaxID=765257 RepID=A0A0D0A8X3_9AGAM|nr:hypothetical protein PISMIDRAFT_582012 [Pisolithus microcarpus 441]